MARSKTDIADMAARILKLAPAGQGADGASNAVILTSLETCHAELAHMGIAFWDINETPDGAAPGFAEYVAGDAAGRLVPEERANYYRAQMPTALRRMTLVAGARDHSDEPVKFLDY